MYYCFETDNPVRVSDILGELKDGTAMKVVVNNGNYICVIKVFSHDPVLDEKASDTYVESVYDKFAIAVFDNNAMNVITFKSNTDAYNINQISGAFAIVNALL